MQNSDPVTHPPYPPSLNGKQPSQVPTTSQQFWAKTVSVAPKKGLMSSNISFKKEEKVPLNKK